MSSMTTCRYFQKYYKFYHMNPCIVLEALDFFKKKSSTGQYTVEVARDCKEQKKFLMLYEQIDQN